MIRAIVMPLKSQMPFLLGRCQTLPQVRPTSSILRWFGRDAAVPYPHGRMAKDNQLEGIPSMRLLAVFRWIEPHYQPPHLTALLHAHACKPAKLHIWVRTLSAILKRRRS